MKVNKRPVMQEAFQMTETNRSTHAYWPEWAKEASRKPPNTFGSIWSEYCGEHYKVKTHEGVIDVDDDDWIVKGAEGQILPWKPVILKSSFQESKENITTERHVKQILDAGWTLKTYSIGDNHYYASATKPREYTITHPSGHRQIIQTLDKISSGGKGLREVIEEVWRSRHNVNCNMGGAVDPTDR
jgi:hypothetical protein